MIHEKCAEELVKHMVCNTASPPDVSGENLTCEELDEKGKHRFRSAMGTLLYLSQDRIDIQHSVRHVSSLSQYMSPPTVAAEAAVRHVILHLKGPPDLGILIFS